MDMNAINQNIVADRGNGKWSVSNDYTGRSDWFNSEAAANAWYLYLEERTELGLVPEAVIDEMMENSSAAQNSNLDMRWYNCAEELEWMMAEAAIEFGGGA